MATPHPGHSPSATEIIKSSETGQQAYDKFQKDIANNSAFRSKTRYIKLDSYAQTQILEALEDLKQDEWKAAQDKIKTLEIPFARRLFNWLWMARYDGEINTSRTMAFVRTIPDWPHQLAMRRSIERSLNTQTNLAPVLLAQWFHEYPPLTANGMAFYLKALEETRNTPKAKGIFLPFWENALLTTQEQKYYYQNYRNWLSGENHLARLDTLLLARQYTNARNLASALSKDLQALVEARIALAENKSGVDWYIRRVPDKYINNAGLKYERVKWRRRHKMHESALSLLKSSVTFDNENIQKKWWHERHIMARHLLENKDYKTAYNLVSHHLQNKGFSYAQAEWLAGWLALNFLDKPGLAIKHFQNLFDNVTTPISRARGAYWSGRVQERLYNQIDAAKWYKKAAAHGGTFYGQMAVKRLTDIEKEVSSNLIKAALSPKASLEPVSFAIGHPAPQISHINKYYFNQAEMVQAFKLLHSAELIEEAESFLDALSRKARTPQDYKLVADLGFNKGIIHKSLETAKNASYDGIVLPRHQFPKTFDLLEISDSVNPALIYAIMRQESAFNPEAASHAGARGLMQLMPGTANALARKYRLRHKTSWLTQDPAHNIRLGVLYLENLLDRYNGSYVLATAAYNAGPSNVKKWLAANGDPRKDSISWIDWIEMIPYYETRNYVQRVLEATQVYKNL